MPDPNPSAAPGSNGPAPDGGAPTGKDRLVGLLATAWSSMAELLASLSDEEWERPALPGWDVHDVVAHLVGTERMLSGEQAPEPPAADRAGEHVRNDIARVNEGWVVALRARSHAELLADFVEVTARRLAALAAMGADEFDAPSWTPVGQATYGRFMEIRVFDCWMHEHDVRAAVGRPGDEDGPVAEQSLAEVVGSLGYVVGKRVGAPDGSSVTIHLTGPIHRDVHVLVDGRARVVDSLDGPATASVSLPSTLFLRLAGGRVDPEAELANVELGGDPELAHRLATRLAFTI